MNKIGSLKSSYCKRKEKCHLRRAGCHNSGWTDDNSFMYVMKGNGPSFELYETRNWMN